VKLYTIIILLFTSACVHAHHALNDSSSVKSKRVWIGARAGLLSSGFAHNGGLSVPAVGRKTALNWHAGITADFTIRENYGARVELNYLSKGAKEQFANDKILIESRNNLSYLQLHALPVILKTQIGKTVPYLALGGYYARRVKIVSKWKPGTSWENDQETPKILNQKSDYGYSVSLGLRTKSWPHVEIRYEAGLRSVSSVGAVKNRSFIIAVSI
jgi:hypothetical protein